ncbi:MAG: branched-chain alpha-keto acid dehydrogenase subunit E2 [Marinilabiliales bacterium]|nr:MAG: branched-chain alpha-keto acid dehydrogenase subunit E2 [Marinilabiliales bacterium]
MIKEIKLPEIADNIDVATVVSIHVSVGDTVSQDESIAEMESDKAVFDLPTDTAGTIKEIKVKEGDEVKVGQVVLTVDTGDGGEEKEEKDEEKSEAKAEVKEKIESEEKDEVEDQEEEIEEKEKEEEDKEEEPKSSKKEVAASPSVRRLARELGVEIHKVEGTGPYNRISAEDVKAHAKSIIQQSGDKVTVKDDYELPDFSKYGDIERQPMDKIRKITADNMTASWQTIPHVFQFDKADVTNLETFRKKYEKVVEKEGGKLTVTSILLKITAKALEKFPKFNASLDFNNKEIIYKKYIHMGVAVDTERGLLVPVIRDVNKKTITELSVELGEMAEKARNKKIMPDELQGGNFAISNLGGIGGTGFTPIVYRPNVAILGVSRSSTEPVFINGEFKPRMMLPLSLSYDHRLIDGAEAARFLRWICEALENSLITMF